MACLHSTCNNLQLKAAYVQQSDFLGHTKDNCLLLLL